VRPTAVTRRSELVSVRIHLAVLAILGAVSGDAAAETQDQAVGGPSPSSREVQWKDGEVIRVRVPVALPDHEVMTTIAFPEERIETAITGWPEGSITATARRGLLFLRLPKKTEGHLSVIGGSGTHYLFYLEGVEKPEETRPDAYLKIRRESAAPPPVSPPPGKGRPRPVGALELIQAMRTGLHPEGAVIVRARGEVAHRSDRVELRLVYVYKLGSYVGRVYDLENLTLARIPVDASRFRAKDETLVASGLRENVLGPREVTRLYTVFWRD
jgi:hypothetical protein